MLIHAFLYDPAFVNPTAPINTVLKTGGTCVLSPQGLSYFVTPETFTDPRTLRANNLNASFTTKAQLILDQTEFASVLSQVVSTWTSTEQQNLFAIIDQLCFAYNANSSHDAIETALHAWAQYVPNTFVLATTTTTVSVFLATTTTLTAPDYVDFSFSIAGGTQYEFRIWLKCALFLTSYPLSTVALVVPPLPITQLYTADLISTVANIFNTALAASESSQAALASFLQRGEYSGYIGQDVQFTDTNGNFTTVQFNILYNGAVPGQIAIRTAIRTLLLTSGIGNQAGWQARAPALFVTQLFYLVPEWNLKTSLVNSVVFPNIVQITQALNDMIVVLFDVDSGFITTNLAVVTATYNTLTVLAVPDVGNGSNRLALEAEHPTYQAIASTNPAFAYMNPNDQAFATLLNAGLSFAAGNPNTNNGLLSYTPSGDSRSYITFSVADVEYWLMTEQSYNTLIAAAQ